MNEPKLSTMVVLYNMNFKVDTDKLLETLQLTKDIIKIEKRGILRKGESSRDKIKRRSKKESKSKTGFGHNSITIVLLNNGNGKFPLKEITVKIFQNGVFHLTGVLDDSYDSSCMNILCNEFWNSCSSAIINKPETYEILKRRVVLMNYTTQLNPLITIPREIFYNTLKREGINVTYNPDVYPGIKIQFENKMTVKIFRTGKIILTGITTKEQCKELMNHLSLILKYIPNSK